MGTVGTRTIPVSTEQVQAFSRLRLFGKYFEDVYLPEGQGFGGRFIPSSELCIRYPDDLEAGIQWSIRMERGQQGRREYDRDSQSGGRLNQ